MKASVSSRKPRVRLSRGKHAAGMFSDRSSSNPVNRTGKIEIGYPDGYPISQTVEKPEIQANWISGFSM